MLGWSSSASEKELAKEARWGDEIHRGNQDVVLARLQTLRRFNMCQLGCGLSLLLML